MSIINEGYYKFTGDRHDYALCSRYIEEADIPAELDELENVNSILRDSIEGLQEETDDLQKDSITLHNDIEDRDIVITGLQTHQLLLLDRNTKDCELIERIKEAIELVKKHAKVKGDNIYVQMLDVVLEIKPEEA